MVAQFFGSLYVNAGARRQVEQGNRHLEISKPMTDPFMILVPPPSSGAHSIPVADRKKDRVANLRIEADFDPLVDILDFPLEDVNHTSVRISAATHIEEDAELVFPMNSYPAQLLNKPLPKSVTEPAIDLYGAEAEDERKKQAVAPAVNAVDNDKEDEGEDDDGGDNDGDDDDGDASNDDADAASEDEETEDDESKPKKK